MYLLFFWVLIFISNLAVVSYNLTKDDVVTAIDFVLFAKDSLDQKLGLKLNNSVVKFILSNNNSVYWVMGSWYVIL